MSDEPNLTLPPDGAAQAAPLTPPAAPGAATPSGPATVLVGDGGAAPVYANFCEIRRTPEEVIPSLG